MQKIKKRYTECSSDAFQQLKITHNLVLCGLMAALAVVLNYTTSIFITPNIRIGFSGLPNRVVEYMFGPCVGAVFGGMLDILKYLLKPDGGAFFFGYTFNVMVAGIIYGTILYRRPVRLWRIFIAEFLTKAIVNCGLNTLWLAVMNGNAFLAILPARVIKNIIMLPIDTVILFFTLTFVSRLLMMPEFRKFRSGKF